MNVKILGSGCKKCLALTANVRSAAKANGINLDIEKVTDIVAISGYGVMATPGLVINGKVVSTGRVLSEKEIGEILEQN